MNTSDSHTGHSCDHEKDTGLLFDVVSEMVGFKDEMDWMDAGLYTAPPSKREDKTSPTFADLISRSIKGDYSIPLSGTPPNLPLLTSCR